MNRPYAAAAAGVRRSSPRGRPLWFWAFGFYGTEILRRCAPQDDRRAGFAVPAALLRMTGGRAWPFTPSGGNAFHTGARGSFPNSLPPAAVFFVSFIQLTLRRRDFIIYTAKPIKQERSGTAMRREIRSEMMSGMMCMFGMRMPSRAENGLLCDPVSD